MKGSILVVDDERAVRVFLRELFEQEEYEVFEADSLKGAEAALTIKSPEVVVLDLGLPDGSGLDIIPKIKKKNKSTEIIVITAMGTVDKLLIRCG